MLELQSKTQRATPASGQLRLPFDLRQKSRLRTQLVSGEDAWLMLPRGDILRGGDKLLGHDGRVIEVLAAMEEVIHITCNNATALAKAAYHLGNRHVPVEVGDGYLRIAADHVLAEMLKGLGATLTSMQAPFEPEGGAYGSHGAHGGGHHHHHHDSDESEPTRGARIHEYAAKNNE
jgi:urease accessory protein